MLYNDDEEEYKKARTHFKQLYSSESPLLQGAEQNKATLTKYVSWRDSVSARCHDVIEYRRLADEVKSLETKIGDLEEKFLESCRQLDNDKSSTEELVEEVEKLRSLLNSAGHWVEDARKIATKRAQVKEKEIDFTMSTGVDMRGRDLQTLQREMEERQEEREQLNTKVRQNAAIVWKHGYEYLSNACICLQVGRLNKELSALMTRISHVNGQVCLVGISTSLITARFFPLTIPWTHLYRRNEHNSSARKRKRSTKK